MKNVLSNTALLLVCLFINCIYAQENEGIPPEPTVASLVTVEKDSVNNSDGLPKVFRCYILISEVITSLFNFSTALRG